MPAAADPQFAPAHLSYAETANDGEDHSSMIAHHEGAVAMAEDVLDGGVNGAIAELARSIVATQQAEIETLRSITG